MYTNTHFFLLSFCMCKLRLPLFIFIFSFPSFLLFISQNILHWQQQLISLLFFLLPSLLNFSLDRENVASSVRSPLAVVHWVRRCSIVFTLTKTRFPRSLLISNLRWSNIILWTMIIYDLYNSKIWVFHCQFIHSLSVFVLYSCIYDHVSLVLRLTHPFMSIHAVSLSLAASQQFPVSPSNCCINNAIQVSQGETLQHQHTSGPENPVDSG